MLRPRMLLVVVPPGPKALPRAFTFYLGRDRVRDGGMGSGSGTGTGGEDGDPKKGLALMHTHAERRGDREPLPSVAQITALLIQRVACLVDRPKGLVRH